MRILVIGNSHCRELAPVFKSLSSSDKVFIIYKGGSIEEITSIYNQKLLPAQSFNPEAIVIHAGHNDMTFHPSKNDLPMISRDFLPLILDFANEVQANHPHARIFLSSLIPRKDTSSSSLSSELKLKYNKLAVRYGKRLEAAVLNMPFVVILNTIMWKRVYKFEEKGELLDSGGLHLNFSGQLVLVKCWLDSLKQPVL
jgi:hypothetical protein